MKHMFNQHDPSNPLITPKYVSVAWLKEQSKCKTHNLNSHNLSYVA